MNLWPGIRPTIKGVYEMKIYSIGDLHLSGDGTKPMDIFDEKWTDHHKKIEEHWLKTVDEGDLVLLPGDLSWAMKWSDAVKDLQWIEELPGEKVLIRGNHDYWWSSISKMSNAFETLHFIQNTHYRAGKFGIAGTRGWILPGAEPLEEKDKKIYLREGERLRRSIEGAVQEGAEEILVMLHYPPTNEMKEPSLFTEIMKKYPVKWVVYGHLHGEEAFGLSIEGNHEGIEYHLVSCDYLDFQLKKILDGDNLCLKDPTEES